MNPLLTALEGAAQRHGAPVIGTVSRNGHSFVGVRFGEDIAFVPGGDNHNIYQFGNGADVQTYSWRDLGTRDNLLDVMAAHAEAHLAEHAEPVRDQWNAEWLDAEARLDAQQAERERIKRELVRAARSQRVRRIVAEVSREFPSDSDDDMRAERDAQRVGLA